MLYYSLTFLVVALLAALLGFGLLAGLAMEIARILFFVFLVLLLVSLIRGGLPKRKHFGKGDSF